MIAAEKWDDDAFIRLMQDVIGSQPESEQEPVHLATERQTPAISWEEFAGNFN